MLEDIKIDYQDMLLDPNNPRFVKDLKSEDRVPDERFEELQPNILQNFKLKPSRNSDEEDVTNIETLYDSMINIGFVPIDRVVVRRVKGSNKYLVIEGNRRISTVKHIMMKYNNDEYIGADLVRVQPHIKSFEKIDCMLLKTDGLSQEEFDHRVSIILGLRHHGALLEWSALAKAYNIYSEYMVEEPRLDEFRLDNDKIKSVSEKLSKEKSDVRNALRTYIPYMQLRDSFPSVKDKHYSLIQSGVIDKYLKGSHFKADGTNHRLNEESLSKMNSLCQFSTRDAMSEGKKVIIKDPKKFKLLGRLIKHRQDETHEAVKSYIDDLISRVEDEEDIDMTIDNAIDAFTAFKNRREWANAIGDLLDQQDEKLGLEDYTGTGNDKGYKDELKSTLGPLRKIMSL